MAAMAMAPMTREEELGGEKASFYEGPPFDPEYGVGCRGSISTQIRAFPNEDILLWRKPEIDNSQVERAEDPKIWEMCWKLFSVTSLVVVVVVGLLLPSAYGLIGGFRLQQLQQKNAMLKERQRQLELEESRLLSPQRLERMAREMHFVDPPPQNIYRLRAEPGEVAASLADPRGIK